MATTPPERRTRWWEARPRALVQVTAIIALGFAAGVPLVPHSPLEGVIFDLVLLNAAPLVASLACLAAARRVPEERLVWWGAAVATVLNVLGNLVYAFAVAPQANPPFPSVADVLWLAGYLPLFLVAWALLRSRVPRPRTSAWLDGLVGALGVTAVAASAFITPAVAAQHPRARRRSGEPGLPRGRRAAPRSAGRGPGRAGGPDGRRRRDPRRRPDLQARG